MILKNGGSLVKEYPHIPGIDFSGTVEIFARRLQTQETMTQQIASSINNAMKPKGVAVFIKAIHQCMTTRGVMKENATTVTNYFTGSFRDSQNLQQRFLTYINQKK